MAGLILLAGLAYLRSERGPHSRRHGLGLGRERVAVLYLSGEIDSAEGTVHWLRHLGEEVRGVKAIVLALDSPGGAVAPSQEICQAIGRLRQEKGIKVVASLGNLAASGAYYVASACDEIVANPGTVTGSIGVIMDAVQVQSLLKKIGAKVEVIKSGEFKDAGSPFRDMTGRDRAVFQSAIDDVYAQFVEDVARHRRQPLAEALASRLGRPASSLRDAELRTYVRALADGRIYTGRQAWKLGLVDSLGGLQDAVDEAASLAGLRDPEVITPRASRSLAEMITGMSGAQWTSLLRGSLLGSPPGLRYLWR